MMGYFTPSEAGAVGTFAVLVLAVAKRDLSFKKYKTSVFEALRTAGMLLMLIAGSTVLGHFIAVTGIPQSGRRLAGRTSPEPLHHPDPHLRALSDRWFLYR